MEIAPDDILIVELPKENDWVFESIRKKAQVKEDNQVAEQIITMFRCPKCSRPELNIYNEMTETCYKCQRSIEYYES